MSFTKFASAVIVLAAISKVSAHGTVSGIVADGVYYQGYSPSFQFQTPPPVVVGWSSPEDLDNGFVSPDNYTDPSIICHKGATPGQATANVKAGGSIELQWTPWPESHKGPVIDYLANCYGPCETVDKTTLQFFKIDGVGLLDGSTAPGKFASDDLIANNNTWTVKIPVDIVPGNYTLRHEIIALHSAESINGAQNYPQCFNLAISGSGTVAPGGMLGTELYHEDDAGIEINIYQTLTSYEIPGPPAYTAGTVAGSTSSATATPATEATTTPLLASSTPTTASSVAAVTAPIVTGTGVSSSGIVLPTGGPYSNSSTSVASPTSTPTSTPATLTTTSDTSAPVVVSSTVIVTPIPATSTAAAEPTTTSAPSSPTNAAPKPSHSSTPTPTMPKGTTYKILIKWLNEVVTKIAAGDKALLGKRAHARDLIIGA